MNPTPNTSAASAANPQRRWFAGLAAATGLAAFSGLALSQTPPGMGRHSPEERAQRMEKRINFLITAVDGTPEQKAKLLALHKTAMTELAPLREQKRKARQDGLALLAEATINRAAVEQLRASQIALADTTSKRMTQLMIDAAEVLTPAQRTKLAALMKQRMERHGGRHSLHGRHGDSFGGALG